MPRQKLSEFRAKQIITTALGLPYAGWSVNGLIDLPEQLINIPADGSYVVKVDQAIKGRFKRGLVALNVVFPDLEKTAHDLVAKGFEWLIIEPMSAHEPGDERYLSLTSERSVITLNYARSGGVNIEANPEAIQHVVLDAQTDWQYLAGETALSTEQLQTLGDMCTSNFFVFMELNPYLSTQSGPVFLDAAVEVDDAGAFFVDSWSPDFRRHSERGLSSQEQAVLELAANSPASFNLSVLEPNGSIFLLLSGGGASVVVADEIYNRGYGSQLGNYGEYSGNPNADETFLYTQAVLELVLQSSASQKVLFIGGAVANFTDIAQTFAGVIRAIEAVGSQLQEQQVKVFVRRGGPNQAVGLQLMEAVLAKYDLLGAVHGPDTPLTEAVQEALERTTK
jgi:succinyl-CoA synthetase beta subunit